MLNNLHFTIILKQKGYIKYCLCYILILNKLHLFLFAYIIWNQFSSISYIGYKDGEYREGYLSFIKDRLDIAYKLLSDKGY